jgi:hypothetical protein
MNAAGRAAAIDAARRCQRVLIADGAHAKPDCLALRRSLKTADCDCSECVSVLTGVEVVWIEGASAVEVVLLREIKTGRLIGINTSAVLLTTAVPAGLIAPAIREQVRRG